MTPDPVTTGPQPVLAMNEIGQLVYMKPIGVIDDDTLEPRLVGDHELATAGTVLLYRIVPFDQVP